jgi:hypothetical protein
MSSNLDDRGSERPRNSFLNAQSAVRFPATLLIMVGVLSAILALLGLIQLHSVPAQCDQMITAIENNPGLPRETKDQYIDMITLWKEYAEAGTGIIAYYTLNIVCSMFIVLGGINMLRLSGPIIPMLSSMLAMVPCVTTSCCCCLGLPVGIWALIILNREDVRAVMAHRSIPDISDEPEID